MEKIKKGTLIIEVQTLSPEKFINLLWNKGIEVNNIIRINLTTFSMEVNLKDYNKLEEVCKRVGGRIKVSGRKGIAFFLMKFKRKTMLGGGILVFLCLIYFLSTYIWAIEIESEKYISPFEIRQALYGLGIKPGLSKNKIDTSILEDKIQNVNPNITWVRARIEGSRLRIRVAEKTPPPKITTKEGVNDVVAKYDAEIIRIYSVNGTPMVKSGDLVKKGQILIKGVEGKEGQEYPVSAQGDVFAKTFQESIKEIKTKGIEKIYTGGKDSSIFINIAGVKIYIKKATKNFPTYDKMISNKKFYSIIDYYETEEKQIDIDISKAVEEAIGEIKRNKEKELDKKSKILEIKSFTDNTEDGIRVRVLFVVEENIAEVSTQSQ